MYIVITIYVQHEITIGTLRPSFSHRPTSFTITPYSCISNNRSPPSFQPADTSSHTPTTSVLDSGPTFTNHQHKDSDVIYIGAALPPISGKLVKRVEQGSFIE